MTKSHSDYYHIDGKLYPRVTRILDVIASPRIERWAIEQERARTMKAAWTVASAGAKSQMAFDALVLEARRQIPDVKRESQKRGTRLHKMCEWTIRGELKQRRSAAPPMLEDESEVESWRRFNVWRRESGLQPYAVEKRALYDDGVMRFGGTVDLLAYYNRRFVVVDYKTGKGLYPEAELQVAAYALATGANLGLLVRLCPDFDPERDTIWLTHDDLQDRERIFRDVWKVWRHLNQGSK